jgi:hypothetical protein
MLAQGKLVKAAWIAAIICMLGFAAAPVAAQAAQPKQQVGHLAPYQPDVNVGYVHNVNSSADGGAGKFTGTIAVGHDTTGRYTFGYIDVEGTLTSTKGTATLYIVYSTNGGTPVEQLIASTGPGSKTVNLNPFKEQAKTSYSGVYIFVCSDASGYSCGNISG